MIPSRRPQNPRWDQVENGLLSIDRERVPRVVPPWKQRRSAHGAREDDNFAFSFVAPLGPTMTNVLMLRLRGVVTRLSTTLPVQGIAAGADGAI